MYLDFFNLKQLPFRLTADPLFQYLGESQSRAKSRLRSGLMDGGGCQLLSGLTGVGKTLMIQDLLAEMPAYFLVVQIRQPEISVNEFYQAVLSQLGDPPAGGTAADSRKHFSAHLAKLALGHRVVIVFIDNADLLADDLFEEILRLPYGAGRSERNLRIILAARTSIEKTLRKPRFLELSKRLQAQISIAPLSEDETRRYIEHRLKVAAGAVNAIFQNDAFAEIQRYTGGVPRLINTLADSALMLAFNRSHDVVTAVDIRSAIDQLQWVEFDTQAEPTEPAGAEDKPMVGHLKIEHGGVNLASIDLPIGKVTFGRAQNNDVRIESPYISRQHCQILTTAQYSVIEDLQSQNGLIISARKVSVHRLKHGDVVKMGEHTLTYTLSPQLDTSQTPLFPLVLTGEVSAVDSGLTALQAIAHAGTGKAD